MGMFNTSGGQTPFLDFYAGFDPASFETFAGTMELLNLFGVGTPFDDAIFQARAGGPQTPVGDYSALGNLVTFGGR